MAKFAPKDEDGLAPYVRTSKSWGRENRRIVWATDLAEAKRDHGHSRMANTSVHVRRATTVDMDELETDGGA